MTAFQHRDPPTAPVPRPLNRRSIYVSLHDDGAVWVCLTWHENGQMRPRTVAWDAPPPIAGVHPCKLALREYHRALWLLQVTLPEGPDGGGPRSSREAPLTGSPGPAGQGHGSLPSPPIA